MSLFTCAIQPKAPLVECYGLVMVVNAETREQAVDVAKNAWECIDGHESNFLCREGDTHKEMLELNCSFMRKQDEHRLYEWDQKDISYVGVNRIFGIV